MTRNKHFRSVFAALLCAVLCMTAFATIAYADGGDYYDDELPPETWQEETQPEDNTIAPGTPFTEDGIAATRDLLYDKHTNKQFITVETRNGHTLYIVIDYDKLLDEEEERYQTYFLNPVDEADLMALLEDDSQNTPVVCSCTEKCTAGKVNTNCALCKMDDPVYDYELAKLAVHPHAQGKGIGEILCHAAIDKAKDMKAKILFLESNTLLKPAIHTYKKLGFKELAENHPAYERGNIQMELKITY